MLYFLLVERLDGANLVHGDVVVTWRKAAVEVAARLKATICLPVSQRLWHCSISTLGLPCRCRGGGSIAGPIAANTPAALVSSQHQVPARFPPTWARLVRYTSTGAPEVSASQQLLDQRHPWRVR